MNKKQGSRIKVKGKRTEEGQNRIATFKVEDG